MITSLASAADMGVAEAGLGHQLGEKIYTAQEAAALVLAYNTPFLILAQSTLAQAPLWGASGHVGAR